MITYVFLLNEAIVNVPTYLLSSSAFLNIKLADLYCTWSKSHRLVDISCWHPFCKVSFSAKILDWCRYLFIKLELYCALASKKKSIPDWYLYITQMETKWTKWYAMTSHVIAYRSTELLYGTHTVNFNCFFGDFDCVFTQIRCLSRLLSNVAYSIQITNQTRYKLWIQITHTNQTRYKLWIQITNRTRCKLP